MVRPDMKSYLGRPTAFYSSDAQKTKLHRFCYECAPAYRIRWKEKTTRTRRAFLRILLQCNSFMLNEDGVFGIA
jgi:hypothetical protein